MPEETARKAEVCGESGVGEQKSFITTFCEAFQNGFECGQKPIIYSPLKFLRKKFKISCFSTFDGEMSL
jgi:hypothetical protein